MIVSSVAYIKGIIGTDDILYDGKFQIAFIGRSNVGKSSVLNSLVRKDIARSSKYPGRTKRLDFFLINNQFYFVDLPGYGFARVPFAQQEKIREMILWYLVYSEVKNRLVILIVDADVGMTKFDFETVKILSVHQIPYVVVANKVDKIKMSLKQKNIDQIKRECNDVQVVPFSTKKRIGHHELLNTIYNFMTPQNS